MIDPHRDWSVGSDWDEFDDVTASEAACYAFCAKAWHLEHVLGHAPSSHAAERRALGIREHEHHGERLAGRTERHIRRLAVVLALLLLVAIVLLALVLVRGT